MTRFKKSILVMSSEFPVLSLTENVTLGFCPGLALSTAVIAKTTPVNWLERVATICAPLMDASYSVSPDGLWQLAHSLSLTCGRLTWFWPVAKFTLSWQDPHAARDGAVE